MGSEKKESMFLIAQFNLIIFSSTGIQIEAKMKNKIGTTNTKMKAKILLVNAMAKNIDKKECS